MQAVWLEGKNTENSTVLGTMLEIVSPTSCLLFLYFLKCFHPFHIWIYTLSLSCSTMNVELSKMLVVNVQACIRGKE